MKKFSDHPHYKPKFSYTTSCGLKYDVVDITKDLAAYWVLNFNTANRKVRQERAANLAAEMIAGKFVNVGDSVRFYKNGIFADGQHRCLGVYASGVTQRDVIVVSNIPVEHGAYIDTGASRSASDVLTMFSNYSTDDADLLAGAVKIINNHDNSPSGEYFNTGHTKGKIRLSNNDVYCMLKDGACESLPDSLDWVKSLGQMRKGNPLAAKSQLVCHFLFNRANPELAEDYLRGVITGIGLEEDSPEYVVKQILDASTRATKGTRADLSQEEVFYTTVNGFISKLTNKKKPSKKSIVWYGPKKCGGIRAEVKRVPINKK